VPGPIDALLFADRNVIRPGGAADKNRSRDIDRRVRLKGPADAMVLVASVSGTTCIAPSTVPPATPGLERGGAALVRVKALVRRRVVRNLSPVEI
jgi:hypothetical protein